jgi:hypothetical protein
MAVRLINEQPVFKKTIVLNFITNFKIDIKVYVLMQEPRHVFKPNIISLDRNFPLLYQNFIVAVTKSV